MAERFEGIREKVFSEWPATVVAALVVFGFAIGTVDAYLESAAASR